MYIKLKKSRYECVYVKFLSNFHFILANNGNHDNVI